MEYVKVVKDGDDLVINMKPGYIFDAKIFKDSLSELTDSGYVFATKVDRNSFLSLLCQAFGFSTEDIDPILAGTKTGFNDTVEEMAEKTEEKLNREVPLDASHEAAFVSEGEPVSVASDPDARTLAAPLFVGDLFDNSKRDTKLKTKPQMLGEEERDLVDASNEDPDFDNPDGEA